jgi:glycosyltransferase involved in cell wall biosynthesis
VTRPRVTIVTPSYNQAAFIRQTIESVLAQDYADLEYIVMDGGSTDGTAAIVADYASRLTWVSERDRGQAHAINKGFQRATGEIVTWLNSDDILLAGAVSRAVAAFDEAPGAGAIYGEGYLMDREGRITGRFPATQPFNLWRLVYLSDYVLQQSTFFRRSAVEAVGWLDEGLHYALDWDLLIKLGKKFGLHYVPDELGVLREYADAKTFSGGERRVEEIRRVLERHTGLKRAPGYWVYKLDTVQRRWRDRLVDRAPWWLRLPGRIANLAVYVPTGLAVMLILQRAQGLDPEGWASDRLKWMLPEGTGPVVVRGSLPDHPRLRGIEVTAMAGGRVLGRWPVEVGEFLLRFDAPGTSDAFEFELRSSRRRRSGLGRTAFRFRSAAWAGPGR